MIANLNPVSDVWPTIAALPASQRLTLAKRILESLEADARPTSDVGPLTDLIGAWAVRTHSTVYEEAPSA